MKSGLGFPFPQPGRVASQIWSFRHITLFSSKAKLHERIVHRDLKWFLERQKRLPGAMVGFFNHLSPKNFILNLTSAIEQTITVFLDIEKAFEWMDVKQSLDCFQGMGLHGRPMKFLTSYLKGLPYL